MLEIVTDLQLGCLYLSLPTFTWILQHILVIILLIDVFTSISLQVPEIISTLRQAGKSSARNNDITAISNTTATGGGDPSETCLSSLPTTTTSVATTAAVSPTAFAKKFEVLFCGRVSVADKKAPPALIDECIEKFSQLHGSGTTDKGGGGLMGGLKRALSFQSNGLGGAAGNSATGSPSAGRRPVLFKRDPSFPCLQALDENGLSAEISHTNTADALARSADIQPTSLQENRTMLFTVATTLHFSNFSVLCQLEPDPHKK